jgi:peptide/nickel transport system permease protein
MSLLENPAPARPGRRAVRDVSLGVAVVLLVVVLAAVVVVPLLPGFDPMAQDLAHRSLTPFTDAGHLLGTDSLGRDMLDRLALAGRTSLLIAIPAVLISMVIGTVLGLCAGYFGGRLDNLVSGLGEIQLAVPILLALIAVVSAVGPSTWVLVIGIGLWNWVSYARLARATALSLREREFVWAPRTQGGSHGWVVRRHIAPHVLPSIAVLAPFDLGVVVLAEAALSYLGLGVQPPTPSWGAMIEEGQTYLRTAPHLTVLPGIALFMLVVGLQFVSRRFTAERGEAGTGARA